MAGFIDVPNVPGVPPLLQPAGAPAIALPTLLTTDSATVGSQFPEQWGVFDQGGSPVIIFDTVVKVEYRQGWVIADFPLEQGAFESYDKVQTPYDVRIRFAAGKNVENRKALIQSVKERAGDLNLYTVITPEDVLPSVNVQHFDYVRTRENGLGVLQLELWLLQIRINSSQSTQVTGGANAVNGTATNANGATPFSGAPALTNTFDPSGMTPFNNGSIQGVPILGSPNQFNVMPGSLT